MKSIYRLFITSQPKGRHVKWGKIEKIICKNESYTLDELHKHRIATFNMFSDLEKLIITLHEEPKKSRPYPDFITISFRFYGINSKVEEILKMNNIKHKTKPIEIENDSEFEYKVVDFPIMPLLNIQKSNVELKDGRAVTKGRDYFNNILSPTVLNENANLVEDIVRIQELPSTLVCTEDIKKLFEKSKLTGFEFKELEIVDYENVH